RALAPVGGRLHHRYSHGGRRLRLARGCSRRRGRPARQGLGAELHVAPVLPGPGGRCRPDRRDSQVHYQSRQRGSLMKWVDTYDIAAALADAHPDVDPNTVRFTQLREWVLALPGFDDDPARCGEKILEAIQMAWIDEAD